MASCCLEEIDPSLFALLTPVGKGLPIPPTSGKSSLVLPKKSILLSGFTPILLPVALFHFNPVPKLIIGSLGNFRVLMSTTPPANSPVRFGVKVLDITKS